MEVNRDEAARALSIAQRKSREGDAAGALRLARKSHSLYPTDACARLIDEYAKRTTTTATQAGSNEKEDAAADDEEEAGLRRRKHHAKKEKEAEEPTKRTHTEEQAKAVKRVMGAKADYYAVLVVEREASEAEIKKAYRKAALVFHPDKNTAPGADEAFKLVAHAFTVLSDKDKRAHYDRFGSDRSSNGPQQQQQHQHHPFARQQRYADEISPEDLFNMFFGGGDLGQFNVRFGQNGGRFAQRATNTAGGGGGMRFNQRQGDEGDQEQSIWASCMQILPLVLLVLSFFASSILSLVFNAESPPAFTFDQSPMHATARFTQSRNVPYWVNQGEFARSSVARAPSQLWQYERDVEAQYVSQLQRRCRQERERKRMHIQVAQGWFGIGVDEDKLKAAQAMQLPACEELKRFR